MTDEQRQELLDSLDLPLDPDELTTAQLRAVVKYGKAGLEREHTLGIGLI